MKIKITESQYKRLVEGPDLSSDLLEQGILNTIKKNVKKVYNYFTSDDSVGCNSLKATNWRNLYDILIKKGLIKSGEPLLIIWGPNQTFNYTTNGKTSLLSGSVSTGVNGFGSTTDSKKTPSGLLKISNKIKARDYEVLVGKTPTGKILGPNIDSTRVDDKGRKHIAEVLTSILELKGLENCNSNTYDRSIYLHGTNKEKKLGIKASNGCVRISNGNIKKLMSMVNVGTKVFIYGE